MEYRKNEIRAGAIILTAFAVAVIMLFSVSDLQGLFRKRNHYKVVFQSNDGLEKHASVRISGISVGRVTSMRVAPELGNKVELALEVDADTVVKDDVKVSIKTLGLVGKKYVDISGGSVNAGTLASGAVLYGEESLKLEDLTKMAMDVVGRLKGVAQNVERIVQNVERTVGDPALARNVKGAVENVHQITEDVKVMTSGKDEVAQTLKNLPELLKKVDAAVANLKEITDKTDKLVGENRKNVDATMANVKEISGNIKELTEDVKKHPWKLIRKP